MVFKYCVGLILDIKFKMNFHLNKPNKGENYECANTSIPSRKITVRGWVY